MLLIVLIIVASLFEGLVLSLLLPLLSALEIIDGGSEQMAFFTRFFEMLNLEPTLGSVAVVLGVAVIVQYSTVLLQNWVSASIQSKYLRILRQKTFSTGDTCTLVLYCSKIRW